MNKDKDFLGTEPVGKLMFRLAIPTITAQLINILYNIIDRIYIGHIPGSGALALTGVGVCMPLIMIVSAFAALVGSGGAPRASIALGKGDTDTAEQILGNCFFLQVLVSIFLTVILLLCNRYLLLAFGASSNTIEYAVNYMNIYAIGTIFVQMTLGMNMFITTQGFTKTGMLSVLIGAGLNIALDPLFIFAFRLGVRGAALATVLSQAVSCIWVLAFLTGKNTILHIRRKNLMLCPKIILPCVALGLATFIMQASESIISVCFNSSLLKYGGDIAVGAMTILTSVMQFAMLPLSGFTQGAQPIISYNFGAGQPERVRKALRLSLRTALICGICFFIFTTLCCRNIVALFIDRSYSAFDIAVNGIPYFGIGFIFFAINMIGIGYYQSIERGQRATIITLLRGVVFMLIGFFVLPPILGVPGIWLAVPLAELLTTLYIIGIYFKDRFIVRRR